jgi:hypothetical protein
MFTQAKLRALIGLVLLALTGCFGAEAMHYDIQEYNKQVVSSEKEMLLYNIAALHKGQPPHFMMLATISQSRTFMGSAGFNWANPATWSVPFTATNTESPTIQFVPIQGQDFANRFESPMTDKFVLFSEDRAWIKTTGETEDLVKLFAQSLYLLHGEAGGPCSFGLNENDGSTEFSKCVHEIVEGYRVYTMIDGSHPVPTIDSIAPLGADIVTALGAGYKWTAPDGKYQLTTPSRIPAWLDYEPKFVAHAEQASPPDGPVPPVRAVPPVPPVFTLPSNPDWTELTYFYVPKDYKPKVYPFSTHSPGSALYVNVLVPEGYGLAREESGDLKKDSHGNYVAEKERVIAHTATGQRSTGSPIITVTGNIYLQDVGSRIAGDGIRDDAKIVAINSLAGTATMSDVASRDSDTPMRVGDVDRLYDRFSYADEVVDFVWPITQQYFYVELRKNRTRSGGGLITDATAERDCHNDDPKTDTDNGVVCGFFKIGNLLQIMQRLANMACPYQDPESIKTRCKESIFGIADNLRRIPPWAENSAPYQGLTGRLTGPYVYVPAHDPKVDRDRAERDSKTFFDLYKLYQMSLVNTSQLVTGAPSITIPASK